MSLTQPTNQYIESNEVQKCEHCDSTGRKKKFNVYYTYAYLNKKGKPYYIGKGKGNRAYKRGCRFANTPLDKSKILILKKNLTEEQAFNHERYMIKILGRRDNRTGILLNLSDGGEGSSGRILSDQTKHKIRLKNIGKRASSKTKDKMAKIRKGQKQSESTKLKRSNSMLGKNKGKVKSDESKAKLSKTLLLQERSKYIYTIEYPDGSVIIVNSLSIFCRKNPDLNYSGLLKAAKDGRKYKGLFIKILKEK